MALSKGILLAIVLAPLLGAVLAGLFGRQIGRSGAVSTSSIITTHRNSTITAPT